MASYTEQLLSSASPLIPVVAFCTYTPLFFVALNRPPDGRGPLAALMAAISGLNFCYQANLSWPPGLASLWGLAGAVHTAHLVSVLCIEKVQVQTNHEHDLEQAYGDSTSTLTSTYRIWQDPQNLNPFLLPLGSERGRISKDRLNFTMTRVAILLGYYLVHQFFIPRCLFPGPFEPFSPDAFAPIKKSFVRRFVQATGEPIVPVTLSELKLRFAVTLYWLYITTALLITTNVALSLLFVSVLRLDPPHAWPPLFGNPAEAYTVRRFWGKFWQRSAVRPFSSISRATAKWLLGSDVAKRFDGIICAFGIFFLAGVTHSASAYVMGDRCGWPHEMSFFMANFTTCAVESLSLGLLRTTAKRYKVRWIASTWIFKMFGYGWVVAYLCWIVPKIEYPRLHCAVTDIIRTHQRYGSDIDLA